MLRNGYVRATVRGVDTDYPHPFTNTDNPDYPAELRAWLELANFPPAPRCNSKTCLIHLAASSDTHKLVMNFLLAMSTRLIETWTELSNAGPSRSQPFETALAKYTTQLKRLSDPFSTIHMMLSYMRVVPRVCDVVLAGCCRSADLPFLAMLRMFSFHVIINTKMRSTSVRTAVHIRQTTMADYVRVYETDTATTAHMLPGSLMAGYNLTGGSVVEYGIHKPAFPATEAHIIPPTDIEMSVLSPIEREAQAPPHTVEHSTRRAVVAVSA